MSPGPSGRSRSTSQGSASSATWEADSKGVAPRTGAGPGEGPRAGESSGQDVEARPGRPSPSPDRPPPPSTRDGDLERLAGAAMSVGDRGRHVQDAREARVGPDRQRGA